MAKGRDISVLRRWRTLGLVLLALSVMSAGPALADPVQVRTGLHEGFGRIVFTWPEPVGHQATVTDGVLTVRFSRPIESDLKTSVALLSRYLSSGEIGADGASVQFGLKGDYAMTSVDSGNRIIVDLQNAPVAPVVPVTPAAAVSAPTPAPELSVNIPPISTLPSQEVVTAAAPVEPITPPAPAVPEVRVRTGLHEGYTRVVFDWPSQTAYSVDQDGGEVVVGFQRPATLDVRLLASGRIPLIRSAATQPANGGVEVTFSVDPASTVKHFVSGAKVVVDISAPAKTPVASAAPAPAPEPTAEPEAPVEAAAETPAETATPLTLTPDTPAETAPDAPAPEAPVVETRARAILSAEGTVSFQFDWDEPVGAAVFRRGGSLWVVFDKPANVDTKALLDDGKGLITHVEQVPSSRGGTALRLVTQEGVNPVIKRSGLSWVLEFGPGDMIPSAPLQSAAQPNSPFGARVFISVPEPGKVVAFRDPVIGDNLAVVPVIPLGHGIGNVWSYPQVKVLPSKQGVVIQPMSDDIRIRTLRQGVELTSASSLQISTVSEEQLANVRLSTSVPGGGRSCRGR